MSNNNAERGEVSIHELKVYVALLGAKGVWLSNRELSKTSGVSQRTVRLHTKRLSDLGVCDLAEVFPGHRFRIAEKAGRRNKGYVERLEAAKAVFGM